MYTQNRLAVKKVQPPCKMDRVKKVVKSKVVATPNFYFLTVY